MVLEFHGSLQLEEYLNWVCTIGEVLDFEEVPEIKKVSLVATRLWGRSVTRLQQLKLLKAILAKSKIAT